VREVIRVSFFEDFLVFYAVHFFKEVHKAQAHASASISVLILWLLVSN